MPAYHSSITAPRSVSNIALLPLRITTKCRGPAPTSQDPTDIIDETIGYFRANIFFRNYEIKSDSDRTLIYITLYISECLKKLQKVTSKSQAQKEMYNLAVQPFDIPGDPGFPLNNMYTKPKKSTRSRLRSHDHYQLSTNLLITDQMKAYISQLRHETGARLVDRVVDNETGRVSKWWSCFVKRRFMEKSLSAPGM